MSVREEILKNIDTFTKDGESNQEFLERVVSEIYELPNSEAIFDGFSKEAKKWFDDAIDVINDNYDNPNNVKDIKDFPEEGGFVALPEMADKLVEKVKESEKVMEIIEEKKSNEIEIGNFVRIETTDGKVVEGNVTEVTKRRVTVGKEGVTKSKIKSWAIVNGEDVEEETPFDVDEDAIVTTKVEETTVEEFDLFVEKIPEKSITPDADQEIVTINTKISKEIKDTLPIEAARLETEKHSCKCSSTKKSSEEVVRALEFFKQGISCLIRHFS